MDGAHKTRVLKYYYRSRADHRTSLLTAKPTDPVSQIGIAIENLANKKSAQSPFYPENTLTFHAKFDKKRNLNISKTCFTQHNTSNATQPKYGNEVQLFQAHLRVRAKKTFKYIQRTPTTTLEDILRTFGRKYVEPESIASAKHRFKKLSVELENQKHPRRKSISKIPLIKRTLEMTHTNRFSKTSMDSMDSKQVNLCVKTQVSVTKNPQTVEKKTNTPTTEISKTNISHNLTYCPKLVKRRKIEENPDAQTFLVSSWITDHQNGI